MTFNIVHVLGFITGSFITTAIMIIIAKVRGTYKRRKKIKHDAYAALFNSLPSEWQGLYKMLCVTPTTPYGSELQNITTSFLKQHKGGYYDESSLPRITQEQFLMFPSEVHQKITDFINFKGEPT